MALVTRDGAASIDMVTARFADQLSGLIAAEDLDACAPCHINSSGLVEMSNGTAANADAAVHGFTARSAKAGEPVTLFGPGVRMHYADGTLTPGATLYLGATDGRLDDGATTGDADGVAFAVTASDIIVTSFKY